MPDSSQLHDVTAEVRATRTFYRADQIAGGGCQSILAVHGGAGSAKQSSTGGRRQAGSYRQSTYKIL